MTNDMDDLLEIFNRVGNTGWKLENELRDLKENLIKTGINVEEGEIKKNIDEITKLILSSKEITQDILELTRPTTTDKSKILKEIEKRKKSGTVYTFTTIPCFFCTKFFPSCHCSMNENKQKECIEKNYSEWIVLLRRENLFKE